MDKSQEMKGHDHYVAILAATSCQCGQTKGRGMAFCQHCYWSLPRRIRTALYRNVWAGFGAAYEAAMEFLMVKCGRAA